jgi:hypothetical protein
VTAFGVAVVAEPVTAGKAGCAPTRRKPPRAPATGGTALGLSGWLRGNPALANPVVAVVAVTNTPQRADTFADQCVEPKLIGAPLVRADPGAAFTTAHK